MLALLLPVLLAAAFQQRVEAALPRVIARSAAPQELPGPLRRVIRLKTVKRLTLVFESGADETWNTHTRVHARLYARLRVVGGKRLEVTLSARVFEGSGREVDTTYYGTKTVMVYHAPIGYRIKSHAKGHLPFAPANGRAYKRTNRGRVVVMGRGLIDRATVSTKAYASTKKVAFTGIRFRDIAVDLVPE